jgi:hypothetical protein
MTSAKEAFLQKLKSAHAVEEAERIRMDILVRATASLAVQVKQWCDNVDGLKYELIPVTVANDVQMTGFSVQFLEQSVEFRPNATTLMGQWIGGGDLKGLRAPTTLNLDREGRWFILTSHGTTKTALDGEDAFFAMLNSAK